MAAIDSSRYLGWTGGKKNIHSQYSSFIQLREHIDSPVGRINNKDMIWFEFDIFCTDTVNYFSPFSPRSLAAPSMWPLPADI